MTNLSKSIILTLSFILLFSSASYAQSYFTISGKITDASNQESLMSATISIKGESSGTTADFDGNFKFRIFEKYLNDTLLISSLGYKNHQIPVQAIYELKDAPFVFALSSTSFELLTATIGAPIILKDIFFEFDKYTLLETSFPELEKLRKYLVRNEKISIEISGHTDDEGDDDYNLALSEARASAVVSYLHYHGIPQNRLTARGYGETKPIVDNDTEENQAKNRRVEFVVIKKDKAPQMVKTETSKTPKLSVPSIKIEQPKVVVKKEVIKTTQKPVLQVPKTIEAPKVVQKDNTEKGVISTIPTIPTIDSKPTVEPVDTEGGEREERSFEKIMPFDND